MDMQTSQRKPKKKLEGILKYLNKHEVRDRLDKALIVIPPCIYYFGYLKCIPRLPPWVNNYVLPAMVLAGIGDIIYRIRRE